MDELETPHSDYIKGFNDGYIISQHMPDLAEKLASALDESNRGMGFKDGRQEVLLEKRREKYPAWRRADWMEKPTEPSEPNKTKNIDKDIDAPEPELD